MADPSMFPLDSALVEQLLKVFERLQQRDPTPERAEQVRLLKTVLDNESAELTELNEMPQELVEDLRRLAVSSLNTPPARAVLRHADPDVVAEILARSGSAQVGEGAADSAESLITTSGGTLTVGDKPTENRAVVVRPPTVPGEVAEDDRSAVDAQLPRDLPAEQWVLGGMMLSKDAIADVVDVLRPDDFSRTEHQNVYDCVLDLYSRGEPADPITVAAELERRGELRQIGGGPYLHTLIATVPTAANTGYYAEIVAEKAVLRRLVQAGTRIVELGYSGQSSSDVNEVVGRAQSPWFIDILDEFDPNAKLKYIDAVRSDNSEHGPHAMAQLAHAMESVGRIAIRLGSVVFLKTHNMVFAWLLAEQQIRMLDEHPDLLELLAHNFDSLPMLQPHRAIYVSSTGNVVVTGLFSVSKVHGTANQAHGGRSA